MLLCRVCNTRFEDGARACPSCGRRASETAVDAGSTGPGPKGASASGGSLPPAQALEEEVDIDLELEEHHVLEEKAPSRAVKLAKAAAKAERTRRKSDGAQVSGRLREPAPSVVGLDAASVRALVAEQPGLLEKGLGVHSDDDGNPVGVDFETPVGDIDLLARDTRGNLVVVMVPEIPELDAVVPEIVQRIGWVRKHLADGDEVRGIAVMENLPEAVGYAAAGVSGMVTFKTFRVALTFQEIKP
jgi:hypothetical protein